MLPNIITAILFVFAFEGDQLMVGSVVVLYIEMVYHPIYYLLLSFAILVASLIPLIDLATTISIGFIRSKNPYRFTPLPDLYCNRWDAHFAHPKPKPTITSTPISQPSKPKPNGLQFILNPINERYLTTNGRIVHPRPDAEWICIEVGGRRARDWREPQGV